MRKVAMLNQKGGAGKTTSCLNLGAGLAKYGRDVLLIDLDPQGHLTDGLGIQLKEGQKTIFDLMKGNVSCGEVLESHSDRLKVLPSDIELVAAEIELVSMIGRELKLRGALNTLSDMTTFSWIAPRL